MSTEDLQAWVARAAQRYRDTDAAAAEARGELREAIRQLVESGVSEVEAAKLVGVSRMTIRKWLGKQ